MVTLGKRRGEVMPWYVCQDKKQLSRLEDAFKTLTDNVWIEPEVMNDPFHLKVFVSFLYEEVKLSDVRNRFRIRIIPHQANISYVRFEHPERLKNPISIEPPFLVWFGLGDYLYDIGFIGKKELGLVFSPYHNNR